MSWTFILLLVVVMVYIANVVGCLILCETIPGTEPVRKYAWYVPVLIFVFPFCVMLDPAIKNKRKLIWGFIRTPHKSISAISSVVDVLKDQEVKEEKYDPFQKKPNTQKQYAHVLVGSVTRYGTAIFTTWLS